MPEVRASLAQPIASHIPIYLNDERWLISFLWKLDQLGIAHDPNSILQSVAIRFTEMQIRKDFYVCAMCRNVWGVREFENHPCGNQRIILTTSLFAKWDPSLPATTLSDAVTALQLLKPGAEAGKPNYIKIYNLLSEFFIYVFFTCRDVFTINMPRIMNENLLSPIVLSPERRQLIGQILNSGM